MRRRSRGAIRRPTRGAGGGGPGPRKRAPRPPPGTPAPANSPRREAPLSPARRAPPSGSRQRDGPVVVVFAPHEPSPDEVARPRPAALDQVGHPVHIVRLPRHAPHVRRPRFVRLGEPVHQHRHIAPYEAGESLGRDGALYLEQLLEAVAVDRIGARAPVAGGAPPPLRRPPPGAP